MTRLLLVAVALIYLFISQAPSANSDCVRVKGGEGDLFVASPAVPSPPLTTCARYQSDQSCCKAAYTDQIVTKTDKVFSNLVTGVLTNVPPECEDLFEELACMFCSPNQSEYVGVVTATRDEISVCESFCNRLYSACGSATVVSGGQPVATYYASGKALCHDQPWSVPFTTDVVSTGAACFDPTKRACTTDDYVGVYTECDLRTGTRDLIYHWKTDPSGQMPCSGGVPLPPPEFGLRCDITCAKGEYLPLGAEECALCPPGNFSMGGGVRYSYWGEAGSPWPSTPDGKVRFSTYCQDHAGASVCNPWVQHGQYIASGENKNKHNIESVLELDLVLVEDGSITFVARVDSETGYDGLRFEISVTEVHYIEFAPEFTAFTYALSKGAHTLRWVYYKDFILSAGDDMAFLTIVEIEGTSYADDECTPCPPGTYNNQPGQSKCRHCGYNYVPEKEEGATRCLQCPSDEYALPGDIECKPREPCTNTDYEPVYTECVAPGVRNLTYQWIDPPICIDVNSVMPEPQLNIPCEPCAPGQYRAGNWKCVYCNDGYASAGNDAPCVRCDDGTAAVKAQYHTTFPGTNWPAGWTTGCDRCDTGGFRRHYDHLDSGDGEGLFNSFLKINATYYTEGKIEIATRMFCPRLDCSLTLWLDQDLYINAFATGDGDPLTYTVPIEEPGVHVLDIDFARWVPIGPEHEHEGTRLVVESIKLFGTTAGGAPECMTCPEGTTSFGAGSTKCTQCPRGTYADQVTKRCEECAVDTIAPHDGMSQCIPCGTGTDTDGQQGQTECDPNGCKYSAYSSLGWEVSFDMSPLMRPNGTMWGPVYDRDGHSYWLNICAKDGVNNTCKHADGSTMYTYVCQITAQGASRDLGTVLSFIYEPNQDMSKEQIIVNYDYGRVCNLKRDLEVFATMKRTPQETKVLRIAADADKDRRDFSRDEYERAQVARTTNVTIVCDPTAGVGYPQAPEDGIENPARRCRYDFVWYSLYGCHICTEKDYDFFYTECKNGNRNKAYYWRYNPKRCHGGIDQLPPTTSEACSESNIVCPDGQYVSPHDLETCVDCPPGNYSVGGGERVDWWDHSLRGFTVYCEDKKGKIVNCPSPGWVPRGRSIATKGHLWDATVLQAERNFLRDGSVWFDFTLVTESGEPFEFFMDDRPVKAWNETAIHGDEAFSWNVGKGTHVFKWKYSPFISDERLRQVAIWAVEFDGTGYSEPRCSPCKGTLVAEQPGSERCHACPVNTVPVSPTTCNRCEEGKFALPGDTVCRGPVACTIEDYYESYTKCVGGRRTAYWTPLEPRKCTGGVGLPANRTNLACECPKGFFLEGDTCKTCPAGQYHTPSGCITARPGTAALRVREWLSTAQDTDVTVTARGKREERASTWTTGCAGECGTPGWRILGSYMDSGTHFKSASSWVQLEATLDQEGQIGFDLDTSHYQLGPEVVLEFFIDGVPMKINKSSVVLTYRFPVSRGDHKFLWLHNQNSESLLGDPVSKVSNVRVYGATEGGYSEFQCPAGTFGAGNNTPCKACPPGHYSSQPGATECKPCESGTFAHDHGSTHCVACGYGTIPNKESAATECLTDCVFKVPGTNRTYNASGLGAAPLVVDTPEQLHMLFAMSICSKLHVMEPTNKCRKATYVCLDDDFAHANYDAGNILSFVPHTAADRGGVAGGYALKYTNGDSAHCPNNSPRQTIVDLYCQMGARPYTTFELDITDHAVDAQQCSYYFEAVSEYACPLCNSEDVKEISGECISGEREIRYESLIPCIGVPKSKTVSCQDIEVNEFAVLVIAGAVILVCLALVGLALYFWTKKRQFAQKYELLVSESKAPLEMQELES